MAQDATRYRESIETHGLSRTHRQVISWVTPGSNVLELGCASGYIGRILIDEKGCRVTGVEFDQGAAAEARQRGLTVIEGSLEDPHFRSSVDGQFDFVIASDVLEHLREPASALNEFKRWLAPGGLAIISVPNIASWSMRQQLFFRGDFEYQETGVLDRTHVHFFTWITLHKLLDEQGWSVEETMVEKWELPAGGDALASVPKDIRVYLERLGTSRGWAARAVHGAFYGLSTGLERGGTRVAESLAKKWPNLCASHMAMLLRPPAA
jgi:methionine biosynthesis protein MetW